MKLLIIKNSPMDEPKKSTKKAVEVSDKIVPETPEVKKEVVETKETSNVEEQTQPVKSQSQVPQVEEPKKKGFGWGKCCLIGCIVLFLCCICSVGVIALSGYGVMTSKKAPDATLTRITSLTEYAPIASELTTMESIVTEDVNGDIVMKLNEKQAIGYIYSMLQLKSEDGTLTNDNVKKVGVKFTPSKAVVQVDIGLFFNAMPVETKQNFDPKMFDGVNISITLSASADNKTLKVDDFSTGNGVLDTVLGTFKQPLIDFIQNAVKNQSEENEYNAASAAFKKFVITQGFIEITMAPDTF